MSPALQRSIECAIARGLTEEQISAKLASPGASVREVVNYLDQLIAEERFFSPDHTCVTHPRGSATCRRRCRCGCWDCGEAVRVLNVIADRRGAVLRKRRRSELLRRSA